MENFTRDRDEAPTLYFIEPRVAHDSEIRQWKVCWLDLSSSIKSRIRDTPH